MTKLIDNDKNEYDFFISYSSENQLEIIQPTIRMLENIHYNIWYDKDLVLFGKEVFSTIELGIIKSQFSIVFLSLEYFKKKWCIHELELILKKNTYCLPVLCDIHWEYITSNVPILTNMAYEEFNTNCDHEKQFKKIYNRVNEVFITENHSVQYNNFEKVVDILRKCKSPNFPIIHSLYEILHEATESKLIAITINNIIDFLIYDFVKNKHTVFCGSKSHFIKTNIFPRYIKVMVSIISNTSKIALISNQIERIEIQNCQRAFSVITNWWKDNYIDNV